MLENGITIILSRTRTLHSNYCAVFLYRAHVEGVAFKTDDLQSFRRKSVDNPLESLLFPRIGQPRKIRIDLDDNFRNPHLKTKLPERMLYRRNKFNKLPFLLSDYVVRLP